MIKKVTLVFVALLVVTFSQVATVSAANVSTGAKKIKPTSPLTSPKHGKVPPPRYINYNGVSRILGFIK